MLENTVTETLSATLGVERSEIDPWENQLRRRIAQPPCDPGGGAGWWPLVALMGTSVRRCPVNRGFQIVARDFWPRRGSN